MPEMLIKPQIKKQYLMDAENIFKSGQMESTKAGLETVARCLSYYEKNPKTAVRVSERLTTIAMSTRSKKAIIDVADCLSHYEKAPVAAERIADQLAMIAYITESEKAVTDAVKEISRAKNPEEASKIAERLAGQARSTTR